MKTKSKKLLPAILSGLIFPASLASIFTTSTYATGNYEYSADGSSYFDLNAQACVIDNYNSENGASVTSINNVEFDKITEIDCSNRGIKNFRGATLMTNLEKLNLSGNTELHNLDISANSKLQYLNIRGVKLYGTYRGGLDISNNPDLIELDATDSDYLVVRTSAYVERKTIGGEDTYVMDLSNIKLFDQALNRERGAHYQIVTVDNNLPMTYNGTTRVLAFSADIDNVPYQFSVEKSVYVNGGNEHDFTFQVFTRSILIDANIYIDGIKVRKQYFGDDSKFVGDTFDSDDYLKYATEEYKYITNPELDKINFESNLFSGKTGYAIQKVEVISKGSVNYINDTHATGIIVLEDEDNNGVIINYYFEKDTPSTPNTGFFTTEDGSANISNILLALPGFSIASFVIISFTTRFTKKTKAKRF